MIAFTIRNLKNFFRDKSSVFFSLLSVFIIIGLYILFLGDTLTSGMSDIPNARFLMDSWIMAGLLAVTSMTVTLGAFGNMVEDKAKKILKDFYSSPISRSALAGGYILSSYVVGVIMSIVAFALAEVYIVMSGGELLPVKGMIEVLGLILLSVLSSSAMVFFMVSFFNSQNAFATASTVIGTLIGFLTGVYIPIGVLPDAVQWVVKIFPVSHSGVLFRQVIMEVPLAQAMSQAPAQTREAFEQEMGMVFQYGDKIADPWVSVVVLVVTAMLFYGLAILSVSRKKR